MHSFAASGISKQRINHGPDTISLPWFNHYVYLEMCFAPNMEGGLGKSDLDKMKEKQTWLRSCFAEIRRIVIQVKHQS